MASKIIVGFDGSEHAHDALALAQLLARTTRAELTAACVWQSQGDPSHPALGDWRTFVTEQVRKVAEEARSLAGDDVEVRGVVSTSPARGLHDLAEEEDADLIVVGSAHSGSGRLSGPPAQDGGVQMTDSAVTLGPKSNPTQYQGQIVTLSGSRIVAAVSDSSNARVRLDINLQIDTSIGRATGAVRAT